MIHPGAAGSRQSRVGLLGWSGGGRRLRFAADLLEARTPSGFCDGWKHRIDDLKIYNYNTIQFFHVLFVFSIAFCLNSNIDVYGSSVPFF